MESTLTASEKQKQKLAAAPKPRLSNRFDTPSLYFNGVYYFLSEIKETTKAQGNLPYQVEVVYLYRGKWYQDTRYLNQILKDFLLSYWPSK